MEYYLYLYQITNKVIGKIYVGVHKTKSLDDGYMGSGKIIRSAIAKHGISNFSKVILETFEDEKSMYAREKEVVNDEFLSRDDVYNLRRGGSGGFEYINKNRDFVEHNRNIALVRDYTSTEYKEKLSSAMKMAWNKTTNRGSKVGRNATNGTTGKTWKVKNRTTNSQTGTIWITDGVSAMKIKNTDSIPEGYRRGRTTIL